MAYEQRDNEGSLFENDRKQNERQPDLTGKVMVAGVMYWLSGWRKTGGKGEWISLALKPMEDPGQQQEQPQTQQRSTGYGARNQRY